MNEKFRRLYQGLLKDTRESWEKTVPESERTESCFKISLEHWNRCKGLLDEADFGDEAEEIDFFKRVKPLFLGMLEYYTLIYQYLMLCPREADGPNLEAFREKELKKIGQFRQGAQELINYMKSGSTDRDPEFFRRGPAEERNALFSRIFDKTGKWSAPQDGLLAQLEGYRLYETYLRLKR